MVSPKNKTVFNFRGDLVREMVAQAHEVLVTGPNNDHLDHLMELGIRRFVEVPLSKDKVDVLGDLAYFRRLRALMKAERPDVVFAYTPKPVIYGSLAAWSARVPRICPMVTGLGTVMRSRAVQRMLLRVLMRLQYMSAFAASTKVIFQNPDDRRAFVTSRLVPEAKTLLVNGSGVNLDRFAAQDLPTRPSFLFIGRLIRDKGIVEYLSACAEIKRRHPDIECHVVGAFDSNPSAYSRQELEPLLANGVVEYHGEQADVRPFIARSSVLVLPSYHEGTPRSVLEAMAMGRAIVTTDAPGCRETVVDGLNGYLVRPGSIDELANRMERLAENPGLIAQMGNESRRLAESTYDVRKVNATMLEALGLGPSGSSDIEATPDMTLEVSRGL